MSRGKTDIERLRDAFDADPAVFVEREIKRYVAASPANRLLSFNGDPVWDEPVVGFADGDDRLFRDYKTVIADFHLTPREVLERCEVVGESPDSRKPANVSVICWVLPSTDKTRRSLRQESAVPSLRWNHTRWHGQDVNDDLARHLVSLLKRLGYKAVAPELSDSFRLKMLPDGLASTWSHRHAAYAAGLGTFSLNDALITAKGIAVRLGSVVVGARLAPTSRSYESHLANCLFHSNGSCWRCIERCPAGAVSEQGHDKHKCFDFLFNGQIDVLKAMGREEGYIGMYPGCGLCQTGVPCESGIPPLVGVQDGPGVPGECGR